MALALNFRKINKDTANIPSSIYLKFSNEAAKISELNRANIRIEDPAEAMSATTAGLKDESTTCTPPTVRYL